MHYIYDFLLIELILYFYLKLISFFNFSLKEKLNKNISTSTKNLKKILTIYAEFNVYVPSA